MKRFAALLLVPMALVATACGGDDDDGVVAEGASSSSTEEAAAAEDFNEADVMFAQGMIPHHEGALEMAQLAADRAESPEVKALAGRVEAAQGPEIETMTAWLEEWGEPVEGEGSGMSGMSGMSEDDMAALEAATGAEFDRMFLEMLAEHHRMAIDMAETEVDEGQNADAVALAEKIIADQSAEIEEIEQLLGTL